MPPKTDSNEPSTSVSLLQLACDGDPDGWRKLAQVYGPIVYGWARRCGCQAADAADVMQDTFASVADAIQRFDHERPGATFRGWLWTIVRNKIRDQSRKAQNELAIGGTDANIRLQNVAVQADQPPSKITADTAIAKRRALELLRESFDPRSWRMFWETAIIGRQPSDVAEEMNVSRWAIYKAKARVLQRLQSEMKGLE